MLTIRDLAVHVAPVDSTVLSDVVYKRFSSEPDVLLIPVVDHQQKPLGLVERNAFLLRLSTSYGRALYAHKPVALLMDADPLIVDANVATADFTAATLSDRPSDLMRGFVVTERGRYVGVGATLSLLQAAAEERRRVAADLLALTSRLNAAREEADNQRRFVEAVVEHNPSMIWVKTAADGRYIMLNRAGEKLMGVSRYHFVGASNADFFPADQLEALDAADKALIAHGGAITTPDLLLDRPGETEPRLLRLKKVAIPGGDGRTQYILGVADDITEARRAEAQIRKLAHFDPLTGAPNRVLFQQRLDEILSHSDRKADRCAVLLIDLDRFKGVNDTLGHAVGDELLRQAAARMQALVRAHDTLARLGGDEFAVILQDAEPVEAAAHLAARLISAMETPFDVSGHQARIGASIGIAVTPEDGADGETLLKKADIALYRVKGGGRGAWRFFEAEMDRGLQARRLLEIDLRAAMEAGAFEAHFQPLLNLSDRRIVGFEALMRWRHDTRGWVPPSDFIPVAEDLGLILPLGEWMLRESCAKAAAWSAPAKVAVNISPVQFHARGFVAMVTSALAASGLDPQRLELEITESVLLDDNPATLGSLHQLRALGVRISLDDFGTGYASLAYLRRFPFDKIKIDRSFTSGLPQAVDAAAIIGAVTRLAQDLGMITTAEGVETEAQLEAVTALGCTEAQGYLIGRADVAPERFLADGFAGAQRRIA